MKTVPLCERVAASHLLKKTVRERKESSPRPELTLAKITPERHDSIRIPLSGWRRRVRGLNEL